jgi:penicillin-binding protein 2
VDIYNAIPYSCDTFFYMLGDKLGIDRIVKYATAFGYGQKTGIDLPGEQAGLMPSPEWLIKNFHHRWYPDETLDVAIGQGAVEATPMQLARIIGGIASGGHWCGRTWCFPTSFRPISASRCWIAFPARAMRMFPSILRTGRSSPTAWRR